MLMSHAHGFLFLSKLFVKSTWWSPTVWSQFSIF